MSTAPRTFRIVFMGTPEFAVPSLLALCGGPDEVLAVVTQPDRARGRGQKVQHSPVKAAALERGLKILQPERVRGKRSADFREALEGLSPDLLIVAAYGKILPPALLELPSLGCLNVHASLLPRWRGASPIHHALLAGDAESGVSIMKMEEGLDTGPVYLRRAIPIEPTADCEALHDALAPLGARVLREVLDHFRACPPGQLPEPEAQDDALATYAPMLTREAGRLDFGKPAPELARRVRALHPWPGTFTTCGGDPARVLKVLGAELVRPEPAPGGEGAQPDVAPGTVLGRSSEGIDVACAEGVLRLVRVQLAGRRAMDAAQLLHGRTIELGECLGAPLGETAP